jgi:hypothetical protein
MANKHMERCFIPYDMMKIRTTIYLLAWQKFRILTTPNPGEEEQELSFIAEGNEKL